MHKLYEAWAKRDVFFEIGFRDTIIEDYCQYKGGTSEGQKAKGKTFNAGYEIFIYAFFLGLYADERRKLDGDVSKFGQPIQYWGNVSQKGRKQYSRIRDYMFVAAATKSNIDFVKVDKGEISMNDAVTEMIKVMNEYANGGFYLMNSQMEKIPNYFFENEGFLQYLIKHCKK